jgi:lipoprotein-releasing system ATP-binding protein
MNATPNVIECHHLCKSYVQGGDEIQILDHVDFSLAEGKSCALTGASGSGKSTFLNLLGGLDKPDEGEIIVNGQAINGMDRAQLARFRNQHIGFVYQFHHLLEEFTARENIAMPALIAGESRSVALERAGELLSSLGMTERAGHFPHQLSGGERQRVAIGRAIMMNPRCVLMDEPTGNLDHRTAETVLQMIIEISREHGISVVLVTHDAGIARQMGRTLILEKGKLRDEGD